MSLQILKWYQEVGVDMVVDNKPFNYENYTKKPEYVKAKSITEILDLDNSRQIANNCSNLEELKAAVTNFKGCDLYQTATNVVFSDGNPNAEIMFIGEAPGANEDATGIPFCGDSGKLLDSMLSFIGLTREKNFYITNSIFWRPPANRRPTPEEIATCLPFVEKHIALVKPKLIILVGATAVSSLFGNTEPITKLRRKFIKYNNQYLDQPIETIAIFHPSYLLRQPAQKRNMWHDLLYIRQYLESNNIKI